MAVRDSWEYAQVTRYLKAYASPTMCSETMRRLNAGLDILLARDASYESMIAYSLYPVFQPDLWLNDIGRKVALGSNRAYSVMLVMEYRKCMAQKATARFRPLPSPLYEVNDMLIATMVSGKTDCEFVNLPTLYYDVWLKALDVQVADYNDLKELLV